MNKFEFTAVTWSSRDSSAAAEAWYDKTWNEHAHKKTDERQTLGHTKPVQLLTHMDLKL